MEKRNSTPEKAPHTLAPPRLAHLRTENADSFEIEEVRVSLGASYSLVKSVGDLFPWACYNVVTNYYLAVPVFVIVSQVTKAISHLHVCCRFSQTGSLVAF